MATLNLTSSDFADIAMIWLFDQVMNPDQVNNENLKEFIDDHGNKIRAALMKYYLDSDSEKRLKYKRIGGIFDGSSKSIQQIRIGPDKEIKKMENGKEGLLKKAIKKLVKKESVSLEEEQIIKEAINDGII